MSNPKPAVVASRPEPPPRLGVLESKTVRVAEIPPEAAPLRKATGRLGELWARLLALGPGLAEAVVCRDRNHANNTLSHMRKRARQAGREVIDRRAGATLYVYLKPKP
jgi:hypothetical protein